MSQTPNSFWHTVTLNGPFFQRRPLLRFALLFMFFTAVLIVATATPAVKRAYAAEFRIWGNLSFIRFWVWGDGQVRFMDLRSDDLLAEINAELPRPAPPGFQPPRPSVAKDTLMMLKNRSAPGAVTFLRTSSRAMGYWPMAFFLVLVFAKSLPWQRKCWAVFWGLLLIHVFIAVRLTMTLIVDGFAQPDKPYTLFVLGDWSTKLLREATNVFVHNPATSFAVALLVWFLVAFTSEDWEAFRTEGLFGRPEEATLDASDEDRDQARRRLHDSDA